MASSAIANPLSRLDIRKYARDIRKLMGRENTEYFPILEFVELGLPQIFEGFVFEVREVSEMGNKHGQACPEENSIILREDVYEGVLRDEGRDRHTLAHEVGHFLLHKPGSVAMARLEPGGKLKPWQDPEWQASAFAGELLIPAHLVKGKPIIYVVHTCKVSVEAARYQLSKM